VSATPQSIAAAALRLREEGAALRQRPAAEVLDALCRVLDEWRDPDSAVARRAELEAALVAEVGYSPECVREGLQLGLGEWSGKALREVVARELGGLGELGGFGGFGGLGASNAGRADRGGSAVVGFDLTAVVLAGAIPMPTLLAILLPLVLRSPVLVKTSSRDRVTARHVAQSVAQIDAQLGRCIEVCDFPGSDDPCVAALLAADCVVAMGSDETLQRVAAHVRPPQRWVPYGHRLSLAVVGPKLQSGSALEDVAARIALDTALWDQQGCLSPAAVYVVGSAEFARDMAAAIATALEQAEQRWPRGRIDASAAAAIRNERAEAEMRLAANSSGAGLELHASDDTSWTVVLEPDTRWRPTPLQRFLRVYRVEETRGESPEALQSPESFETLESALRPIAQHLAAVALEGFGDETAAVSQRLASLGASRVCRAGQLQAPPLGWHHDGQPVLLPLARITDLEA